MIVDADQGRPSITLNNGAKAFYTSGSGSKKLVFSYTIEPGQSVESLGQKSNKALQLNGGKITDQAGNNALIALAHGGQRGSLSTSAKINIVNGTKLDDSKQPSLDDTSASIKEDATPGTSILDLADSNSGKDLDAAGNSPTYAIKSGNSSGLFSINPATGLNSLAPSKSLDFESKSPTNSTSPLPTPPTKHSVPSPSTSLTLPINPPNSVVTSS